MKKLDNGRYKVYYKSGRIVTYDKLPKSAIKEGFKDDSTAKEQENKKASEQVSKSETKADFKNKSAKGRILACILYPDNNEQMDFFSWSKNMKS